MALELITFILFFVLSSGITFALIVLLSRAGIGSIIRLQGPSSHLDKKNTPALAGLGFMLLMLLSIPAFALMGNVSSPIVAIVVVSLAYGAIGLSDDLMKLLLKKSYGLKARYRILLQLLIALLFALWVNANVQGHGIAVPGVLHVWIPGYWLIVIDALLLAGFVNAFNFADGLDGLAGGLGIVCIITLGILAWRSNLNVYLGTWPWDTALLPVAVFVGIVAGFLIFNWSPARIFMGDGGSYALGAFIGGYAITTGLHIGLVIAGFVIIAELLSVVIQVISFRTTGKRVFAMTPLHHAFEVKGAKEVPIVYGFWLAGVICALGCYLIFVLARFQ